MSALWCIFEVSPGETCRCGAVHTTAVPVVFMSEDKGGEPVDVVPMVGEANVPALVELAEVAARFEGRAIVLARATKERAGTAARFREVMRFAAGSGWDGVWLGGACDERLRPIVAETIAQVRLSVH